MKYILALGVLLFAFAVPGVNFYHHLELPAFSPIDRISSYHVVNTTFPFLHKHTDIRLETEFKGPERYYTVVKVLQEACKGDTVTFHLIGSGGQSDSLFLIVNNIRKSLAYVVMDVEGPVYSAHAYLAINGDKLYVSKYAFLMFHTSSVVNVDCSTQTGTDRGVSNVEHCEKFKQSEMFLSDILIASSNILTAAQKASIKSGHDVYIYADGKEIPYEDKGVDLGSILMNILKEAK